MRASRSPHVLFAAAGLGIALWSVLPLEEPWTSALTTVALSGLLAWMVAEALFVRWPALRARGHPAGRDREALLRDTRRRAATWVTLPAPRRPGGRLRVTVSAIAGGPPEVRPVAPLDRPKPPAGRPIRRVSARARLLDAELLTASWDAATRRRGELIDRRAVDLGLAREGLAPARVAEPDPLLAAATWSPIAA